MDNFYFFIATSEKLKIIIS